MGIWRQIDSPQQRAPTTSPWREMPALPAPPGHPVEKVSRRSDAMRQQREKHVLHLARASLLHTKGGWLGCGSARKKKDQRRAVCACGFSVSHRQATLLRPRRRGWHIHRHDCKLSLSLILPTRGTSRVVRFLSNLEAFGHRQEPAPQTTGDNFLSWFSFSTANSPSRTMETPCFAAFLSPLSALATQPMLSTATAAACTFTHSGRQTHALHDEA